MKLFSCFCLGALGLANANAQTLHLVLHSPPGEYIGGGVDSDTTFSRNNSGQWFIDVYSFSSPLVDTVGFSITDLQGPNALSASFSSQGLGNLVEGTTYTDAERSGFQSPGHPGMEVAFQFRGSNFLTGNFTVNQIGYHQSAGDWVLDSFDVSFVQYSDGSPLALTGRLIYSAVPEPGSLLAIGAGLTLLSIRRRRNTA